jgi:hypothetical protein
MKFDPENLRDLLKPGQTPQVVLGSEALTKNRNLANLVMRAIALQSDIDSEYSILLSEITKTNSVATNAMLNEVIGFQARRKIISAVVKTELSEDEQGVLLGLYELADKTSGHRNAFAHELWGSVSGLEDYLLMLKSKHYSAAHAPIQQKFARKEKITDEDGAKKLEFMIDKSKMYNKSHLDALLEEMNYIHSKLKELEIVLQAPTHVRQIAFASLSRELQTRNNKN